MEKDLLGWCLRLLILVATSCRLLAVEPLPPVVLENAFPRLSFERPLAAQCPPGEKRLHVVEQSGRILRLPLDRETDGVSTFLDIRERKPHVENEEGLLGLAFHPEYRSNGRFYTYYTQHQPRRSVVSEWKRDIESPEAAPSSERVILEIPQPYGNHNSGCLAFGPDGQLYVGVGDGGSANDPHENGQNLRALLGKILRIDVNTMSKTRPYSIPLDNPFTSTGSGVRGEIWAFGFRNPWGLSFDLKTGDLWAADVGQNKWEEVNLVVSGGNYGWSTYEGFHLFREPISKAVNTIFPVMEYPHSPQFDEQAAFQHSPGLSITGGYVYRGRKMPEFDGVYFYGDFALGTLWGLRFSHGKITHQGILCETPSEASPRRSISGFGIDSEGELYVLSFDGKIYAILPPAEG